jgi:hypothetical protein
MNKNEILKGLSNNSDNALNTLVDALKEGTLTEKILTEAFIDLDRENKTEIEYCNMDSDELVKQFNDDPDLLEEVLDGAYRSGKANTATQEVMLKLLEGAGYTIVKVDSMVKQDRLQEFLMTEIFPTYNEQKAFLFA